MTNLAVGDLQECMLELAKGEHEEVEGEAWLQGSNLQPYQVLQAHFAYPRNKQFQWFQTSMCCCHK